MSLSKIMGVSISGIASAVPELKRDISDDFNTFGKNEVQKISQNIGVKNRYVASSNLCTSDLCFSAAKRLLSNLNCKKNTVDALIFVSQTPDYRLPSTSCILQHRLGLSTDCAAFDINMGCSGYIYGLWIASNLIANGSANRVMLLVGDTSTKLTSPNDRSVALLFGDAGTATLLEKSKTLSKTLTFAMGTDGSGSDHLIVPSGGFRHPVNKSSKIRIERENGNFRSDEDLYMNGPEIFAFTLARVTPLIRSILKASDWSIDDTDYFVFHQANKFIIEHLAKRIKLPLEKVPITMETYGNTSSASIPLAMSAKLSGKLRTREQKLVLSGFGVGYSWGAVSLETGPMVMPEIIFI